MSKISNDGAQQLQVARNALDSIHSKIDSKNFNLVTEEFNSIATILEDAIQIWEKL
jgi:hypothetical protein